ncbi:MAG TPA: SMP-30/gluconolactonase/LRE family protein [Blastocatellia bacterium]|nr:SMP-30/gluconolactonase/LRE family protein [Blastocatellia bacterium]
MRKLFAFLAALSLAVSLTTPAGIAVRTAAAQEQSTPVLKRMRPDVVSAGVRTFTVRLAGKNFAPGAQILFDGVALESPRVNPKGKLLLADVDASLAAVPGTHTVQAMNPDGGTTATATLTVVPADSDTTIQLESNAAQEDSGFIFLPNLKTPDSGEVSKAFVWGKSVPFTEVSGERIQIEIPQEFGDEPASIPINVRDKEGKYSNTEIFFIVPSPAVLDSIDPDTVDAGTEDFLLKVFGTFKPDATILVNNTALPTTQGKNGRLEATVPASLCAEPAQLFVRVQQDGIQSADALLSVTPTEAPFIFEIAPSLIRQGEGRSTIDIVGANFDADTTAKIDGNDAKVRNNTRRGLTVVIPEDLTGSVGSHTVQVFDKDGNPTNTVSFDVVPDVTVSTIAGRQRDGFNQETCVSSNDALLRRPRRLTLAADGLVYFTDNQNHAVRTLNPVTGEVCTVAGTGLEGYNDSGNERDFPPTFSFPNGVALDSSGTIYVTENGNGVVRLIKRIGATTTVETFAGSFNDIQDKNRQKKLNSTRVGRDGYRDDTLFESAFRQPDDILVAPSGLIYIADANNHAIRRINLDGTVETVAGNGVPGFADGEAHNARFNTPTGLALSPDERLLFVADTVNHRVRRVDLVAGMVDTLSGSGFAGSDDGPAHTATFRQPIGLALDSDGTLYVSDVDNSNIRRVDPAGTVNTLAGSSAKFRDGPGVDARFHSLRGLAIDIQRRVLYVADTENFRIRRIALQ